MGSDSNPGQREANRPSGTSEASCLASLLASVPTAAYACDGEGRITYFNQAARELWGRAPNLHDPNDRFCGSHRLHADDGTPIPKASSCAARALATGVPHTDEPVVIETPSGERVQAVAHARPFWDADGRIAGSWNLLVEVTPSHREREALASLGGVLAGRTGIAFFEAMVSELCRRCDVDCAFVAQLVPSADPSAELLAGMHRGIGLEPGAYRLAGTPCEGVVEPGVCFHPAGVASLFPEDPMLASLGAESYLGTPLFSNSGECLGVLAIMDGRDMHDRHRNESILTALAARAGAELERIRAERERGRADVERATAALEARRSEERFRLVAEATLDACYDWDVRTGQVWRSEGYRVLVTGNGEDDGSFAWWQSRLHPEDATRVLEDFAEAARLGSSSVHSRYRFLRVDGTYLWLVDRCFLEYGSDGELNRVVGGIADVTAGVVAEEGRRALEARMRDAQKLESLGLLAGGIAHDFNNFLTGVLGYATLAELDLPDGSPARSCLDEIKSGVHQAAELTRQMLAYSGRSKIVIRDLQLDHIVSEMQPLLSKIVSRKAAIAFQLERAPMRGDGAQMRQIVMNLITNASDALGEQAGAVRVETGMREMTIEQLRSRFFDEPLEGGWYAFVEVTDDGCGMATETLDRIFDPFFTTKFTGRGLGLAAVLGIVRGHRGSLHVASEIGRGTTFAVYLPASSGPGSPSPLRAEPSTSRSTRSGTLLLVEDEDGLRRLVRDALERVGYRVHTASDGQEGIDTFLRLREEIDAVILDITMPRRDGWEVLGEIRAARPGVPVLLTSGFDDARSRGDEAAVDHRFLQKPFTLDALRESVEAMVEGRGEPTSAGE